MKQDNVNVEAKSMSNLTSKGETISLVVFAIATLILDFVPQSLPTKVVVDCLLAFTVVLYGITREKKGLWIVFNWIWVALLLPYLSVGVFLISFLTLVSPENLITWGLATYLSLVPVMTFVLLKWFKAVLRKMFEETT